MFRLPRTPWENFRAAVTSIFTPGIQIPAIIPVNPKESPMAEKITEKDENKKINRDAQIAAREANHHRFL